MKSSGENQAGQKENKPDLKAAALNHTTGTAKPVTTVQRRQAVIDNSPRQLKEKEKLSQLKPSDSGLPPQLQNGVEQLSGISMQGVQVHYNSALPAQLQAHAFAQGNDIHLASGQEKHLPHEAWHVVQQKQGRVKPTLQMKKGIAINDDAGLEKEADLMGARALRAGAVQRKETAPAEPLMDHNSTVVQRLIVNNGTGFQKEFSGANGWIIASDVYIALQRGGGGQAIVELKDIIKSPPGKNENIYLVGHGSAGKLGHYAPDQITAVLNQILPNGYSGEIISLSCSAGVGKNKGKSGVKALADNLNKPNVRVSGAAGVALNHTAYEGDKRVIKEDKSDLADQIIDEEVANFQVNETWLKYISTWSGDLYEAAKIADEISRDFYIQVETRLEKLNYLLPKDKDTTTVSSSNGGGCYITTACTRFQGLSDDCEELMLLRKFRDEYILSLPGGMAMVQTYYQQAPRILSVINQREEQDEIYRYLYRVIRLCVKAIQAGKYSLSLKIYLHMLRKLEQTYC